jgi:hypothetical protein
MHLKSAVTRELFNLITELRVSMPSGTLAEHVKRELMQQKIAQLFLILRYKNSICSDITRQGYCTSLLLGHDLAD